MTSNSPAPQRAADGQAAGQVTTASVTGASATPGGLERDLADDRADQPLHRDLVLAEQHDAVVDASLRVRLEARRMGLRQVQGVPADRDGV
ncbi:hypothetical protein [Micromonospora sp. LOL_023]|uniref:hypothetical protein n=1 Tax=Micromonospora sp. LOL_023 TaxID=3345418 RepID=UPI003A8B1DFC